MESVRELIEKRAYELFLNRKGEHGYHIQDWIQAEKDVMAQLEKKPASEAAATPRKKTVKEPAPKAPAPATAAPQKAPAAKPQAPAAKAATPAPVKKKIVKKKIS